jgi:hypothetical protein
MFGKDSVWTPDLGHRYQLLDNHWIPTILIVEMSASEPRESAQLLNAVEYSQRRGAVRCMICAAVETISLAAPGDIWVASDLLPSLSRVQSHGWGVVNAHMQSMRKGSTSKLATTRRASTGHPPWKFVLRFQQTTVRHTWRATRRSPAISGIKSS